MSSKKRFVWTLVAIAGLLLLFLWQLPGILKAMPSRYVARLPEPMQVLGTRGDGVAILPTIETAVDTTGLLAGMISPTSAATATATAVSEPPTPSPFPAAAANDLPVAPTQTPTPALPATSSVESSAVEVAVPTQTPTSIPVPSAVRLDGFQHLFQTWNNCGPATTAMALSYFGLYLNQADTAVYLKPDPEDRNVSPYEISNFVNEQTPYAAIDRTNGTLETVKRLVANGFPVVIELGIEPPGEYRWLGWYGHYLLIVAYDDALEQFWVYDSWFGTSDVPMENATKEGRVLHYAEADTQWRQFNRNYIVFYQPERQAEVQVIIGEDIDDGLMWQNSLARTQTELNQEPQDAFLWFNLGTIYNELGEYEQAATAFDQARAIGLPWRMLWYQFGPYEAYYQVGRYEDVLLLTDVTLKDRPYFEESFYYHGLAQEASGDTGSARTSFQKAANFNPLFQPAIDALNRLSG